ncbi:MAG: AAA family ATPase [Candidatus Woesearchaeota archaeon]
MKFKNLENQEFSSIIGLNDVKKQLKSALLLNRHVVLVGNPGMGKTTLVKDVANTLQEQTLNDCPFHCSPENPVCPSCLKNKSKIQTKTYKGSELFIRVQGSPDLTVEDLMGDIDPIKAMEFGPLSEQAFTPGKIFKANNGVLFFDEINRCSQRLQNALLQVLQEKKVTIGNFDLDIPVDFVFIGTMNPGDTNTEPLSDVLLDRFDLIYVHYPESQNEEEEIVNIVGQKLTPFPNKLFSQMILFLRNLRKNPELEIVPSVRASIGLYERSQAIAKLNKHKEVRPLDIMEAMTSVLAHRIKLKPSLAYSTNAKNYLQSEFNQFCEGEGISLASEDVP